MSTQDPGPPSRPGRIVVGVDGSSTSAEALRWAIGQGRLTGWPVEAVISWKVPVDFGVGGVGAVLAVDWGAQAATTLAATVSDVRDPSDGVQVQQRVEMGHPAQALLDAAADADLLVVGSRGRGGFTGMLLGSVSQAVVSRAPCPVVVVRPQKPEAD